MFEEVFSGFDALLVKRDSGRGGALISRDHANANCISLPIKRYP